MGIFEKKYDIEKDGLQKIFNPDEKRYDVYYGMTLIPHQKLNKRSKKQIENANNNLINNKELLAYEFEKISTLRRFEKLRSLGYICDSFEYLGQNEGSMSKQMEDLLKRLVSEEDVLLGIHRIGANDSLEKITDILKNGLEMTGHLGYQGKIDLKNNVGYYPNNKTIIKELMYADMYKNSKGSILIRIPDSDLTQNIFAIDSNNKIRLNPKYIIGYVPLYENHHLETIITLESLRKDSPIHNLLQQCDIDYYDEEAEYIIKR